ncbi:hypothetical protein [Niastella sp. OAS944]|uniref:hypothetical protein n=1 Tax=Niastella sp. OAS944 TaxID=2664089 RepID=UPI003478FA2D|nr:hypothetical protein [Chitinophagaceae bacterium OAS944]
MPVHIGKEIQKEVERQKLTYKEFGALIFRNEKTIPDIYDRASMAIDLLVIISIALKKDFLSYYYDEPPMKYFRDDVVSKLKSEIQTLTDKQRRLEEEYEQFKIVTEANMNTLAMAKDLIGELKSKIEAMHNTTAPGSTNG